MGTINFKIDYNSVKTTNPEMGSEALARKSRYILENKLVFDDPVILRVGLYARLSVEDGDDEISDSIATQLAIGAGFFALNPELIHVKTYIDDGYSGLEFDRPDFQNMMDDLRTGLINCVVVKDVSRAGRNYKNLGTFLSETIRDMGVRFFSILDEYDSAEDEDGLPKLSVILQTVLDQKFSENAIPIRENLKRLEAEECEQRQIMDAMDAKVDSIAAMKQLLRDFLKTKDLSKEVVEALVRRIVVGVEHAFTVEYKFDFGE